MECRRRLHCSQPTAADSSKFLVPSYQLPATTYQLPASTCTGRLRGVVCDLVGSTPGKPYRTRDNRIRRLLKYWAGVAATESKQEANHNPKTKSKTKTKKKKHKANKSQSKRMNGAMTQGNLISRMSSSFSFNFVQYLGVFVGCAVCFG